MRASIQCATTRYYNSNNQMQTSPYLSVLCFFENKKI